MCYQIKHLLLFLVSTSLFLTAEAAPMSCSSAENNKIYKSYFKASLGIQSAYAGFVLHIPGDPFGDKLNQNPQSEIHHLNSSIFNAPEAKIVSYCRNGGGHTPPTCINNATLEHQGTKFVAWRDGSIEIRFARFENEKDFLNNYADFVDGSLELPSYFANQLFSVENRTSYDLDYYGLSFQCEKNNGCVFDLKNYNGVPENHDFVTIANSLSFGDNIDPVYGNEVYGSVLFRLKFYQSLTSSAPDLWCLNDNFSDGLEN